MTLDQYINDLLVFLSAKKQKAKDLLAESRRLKDINCSACQNGKITAISDIQEWIAEKEKQIDVERES